MIVDVQNIHLTYQAPDGEVNALEAINFSITQGEFVSLVGPSGCGKSTLLSIIAGLIPPTQGQVLVEGQTVTAPSQKIGYMPQKDQLFPWRTIWDNVTLGLELRHQATAENKDRVRDLLERYGLADFANKTPNQLSGGMRQRCALIRTLALSPSILLLDEPFSALDYQTRLAVSADIHHIIANEGKTALLVTHDISESVSLSERVLVLSRRPAHIQSSYTLDELQGITPLARRDHPSFGTYFNAIWKELDVHA
ncbi:ABC transporter ATP-binding protein [Bengtsoniella intestinalis]|uniref:ABC transporter ATP-binding protein n=1 Tax=Bengtsoniella intestinalis TaxID=3073143 RepID=UPI00391FB7F4